MGSLARGAISMKVTWQGDDAMKRTLDRASANAAKTMAQALYAEAQVIFAESQKQVPWDTGALAGSGIVHPPTHGGQGAMVEVSRITYGGPAVRYAEEQHENLSYRHAPGRKAHYLSDPIAAAMPRLNARVKRNVRALLKGA